MKYLVEKIDFREIYFRNRTFGRLTITGAINHLSEYLKKNIFSSSPFILLSTYNHIKSVIAYYAILKAGKIAAILDPYCKNIKLTEIIEDIDPSAIIFVNSNSIGFNYEEEIIFRKPTPKFIISSDLKDVCTLVYTNAEDGYSKGAMLTENNLLAETNAIINIENLNKGNTTCALLPFHHLFGLVKGILMPTHAKCNSLIVDLDIFRIDDIANKIYKYKVTNLYSVPSLYYLLSKIEGIDTYFNSVKECVSGGSKLSEFINNSFIRNTGIQIREGYGLTESSPACTVHYQGSEIKLDSIGLPFPCCEIKILDEGGNECKTGEIGEICIRGDIVFKGYFNKERTTTTILRNGWLHSGDYGKKDKQGYIYFAGLKKNMINVGGTNVYPEELVRLMKQNKNVSDISIYSESSVLQGQIAGANIKLKDSSGKAQSDFKNWCYKNITNSILPRYWNFV
jgi:long-chain acyl-CoA synthetase